jgi:nicotinamide-nucleotide amidase
MNACILSIGDELVLGQTIDTNSAWLSKQLAGVGCDIVAHATVGDGQLQIETAIRELSQRADVLIISGGIGPTEDDLTRQALAAVLDVPLERNEEWIAALEAFFARSSRKMPEINKVQAFIPRGATMIYNHAGTAAGIRATLGTCEVFSTPGVPKEMKAMFERDVLPYLRQRSGGAVIASRLLHSFGLGESAVGERMGALMTRGRNPSVGTTVANGFVSLRLNVRAASSEEAQRQLDDTEAACRAALGDLIFGQGEDTLPAAVLGLMCNKPDKFTIATAESCTGGLLSKMLTDVPGCSPCFHYGWVTYANEAKTTQLGVPKELFDTHGAVSEPVARAMAIGARDRANANYALAITGVAGPDGGTAEKPVGTVWIALATAGDVQARRFNMHGDREMIRDRAAKMALTMLRFKLLGKEMPF